LLQQVVSDESAAIAAAEQALRSGELGVVLVAGGQGSRLGFPHPKGMYKIGPVSERSLFQMHVDQIKALRARYGAPIPLYVMTSPATHEETVEYFRTNNDFGLAKNDLHFFCQGTMPAVDLETGKVLLAAKDTVFASPDGHGGMLSAFTKAGCLVSASERGVKQLFYFQVDNPLVSICDRRLVGYHLLKQSEMTTQVIAKIDPLDRVGNVVVVDGRMMVIEYSDLPESAARRTTESGELELWAGSIAVHVFDVDFLERSANVADSLPFHRANKSVPHINDVGELVEPTTPNAIKFERFIFDLMPAAKNALVVEAETDRIFAPLKNASGAEKDTPETTRAAIARESRRLLEAAGVTVAADVLVEVNPLVALDADQLQENTSFVNPINRDTYYGPRE
ncbi:UTP--glucose-1-phosphate uridylyltransferase, partial [Planctomycetota bacterium]